MTLLNVCRLMSNARTVDLSSGRDAEPEKKADEALILLQFPHENVENCFDNF
jgi:hypothetical protein